MEAFRQFLTARQRHDGFGSLRSRVFLNAHDQRAAYCVRKGVDLSRKGVLRFVPDLAPGKPWVIAAPLSGQRLLQLQIENLRGFRLNNGPDLLGGYFRQTMRKHEALPNLVSFAACDNMTGAENVSSTGPPEAAGAACCLHLLAPWGGFLVGGYQIGTSRLLSSHRLCRLGSAPPRLNRRVLGPPMAA